MRQTLEQGLPELGMGSGLIPRLAGFAELVLERNQVMNLTAITEPKDVAALHLLDSLELAALAGAAGLNVIAAATFVGEHSYSSDRWPIAAGRPDADDLALAAEFGGRVAGKLQDTARGGRTDTIDVSRISRPRQPLLPLLRFIAGVIRLRRGGKPLPRTPQPSDRHSCTHCGLCVTLCPSGAIARGDETRTDATKCIRCCACVKSCPSHARIYDTPFASLLSKCFKRRKAPRTIL